MDRLEDAEEVAEIMEALARLVEEPPRYKKDVAELIPAITVALPMLHGHMASLLRQGERRAVGTMMSGLKRVVPVLRDVMMENIAELGDLVPMKHVTAWTLLMATFSTIGSLVVLVCSGYANLGLVPSGTWDPTYCATATEWLLDAGLCASDAPIGQYSVRDTLDAIALLAAHWHELTPTTGLVEYLDRLLLRGALLVARPGGAAVYDMEDLREEEKTFGRDAAEPTYSANTDLVRRLSGPLIRMYAEARFVCDIPSLWAWRQMPDRQQMRRLVGAVRRELQSNVSIVANMSDGKMAISSFFSRLIISFGDIEKFAERYDIEPPQPQSVMVTSKSPESQQAWSRLNQVIQLDNVIEAMHEEDADYFERYSFAQHVYCLVVKLYILDVIFRPHGVHIRQNYVVWEVDVPAQIAELVRDENPLFIHIFGRIHILYRKQLYRCRCIEEAIALWGYIVLIRMSGRLGGHSIVRPLRELLYGETEEMLVTREGTPRVIVGTV